MLNDFTKDSKQFIIDLLNAGNGTVLTVNQVHFGVPDISAIAPATSVTLTALPESGFSGSLILHYRRNDLDLMSGSHSKTFAVGLARDMDGLVPIINALYQLNLQPEDYYNDDLPIFTPDVTGRFLAFKLRAKPYSLLFYGALELTLQRDAVSLSSYIANTTLVGEIYVPEQ